MSKLVLIDGNALIHRAYHAIKPLTTRSGEVVNAVYGFTSILMNILTEEQPKYIACTFDAAKKTFRHEKYKEYKATRVKAPDELYAQIPRIHEVVETMQIPKFIMEGFEADDLIGTISRTAEKKKEISKVIIATGDMDALQLISEKICVNNLHKGYKDSKCFTPQDVFDKCGVWPDQIVDYKGLTGDASDNIPGVKGIGEKTAARLLQQYQNLEGIYEHMGDIPESQRIKLEANKENAFFSRELATIKCDVPIDFELEKCRASEFDREAVFELFESLQFYSLIRRLRQWQEANNRLHNQVTAKKVARIKATSTDQLSLF